MFKNLARLVGALGLVGLLVLHLYLGTRNTANSEYTTVAGVYGEYMNGVIRLVFPFVVTLLAAVPLLNQLADNYIQQTRGRVALARHILGLVKRGIVANAIYWGSFGVATSVAATFVAPSLNKNILQPSAFGLTPGHALKLIKIQNPLGFAVEWGALAFGVASTLWVVCSSVVFALVAFACVLVIRRRAAILIPLGIYVGESLLTQVWGASKLSFLLLMPTPSSMGSLEIVVAALPGLIVALLSCATIWLVVRYAPKYGWFA